MDFSWSEMLLVGVVALIVIGPKDLPGMFRELGRITAKLRTMAREFSRAMEQAAKESGVKEATDGLKTLTNPAGAGLKSAADRFEKWDPLKPKSAAPPRPTQTPANAAPVAAAPAAQASVTEAAAPTLGPATAELARKQAARKAVVAEAAAKLRAVNAGEAEPAVAEVAVAEVAAKKPGRVRKKADKSAGDAT